MRKTPAKPQQADPEETRGDVILEPLALADGPVHVTMEHMRQVMAQKAQERVQACMVVINGVLAQHGCVLTAEPVIAPDGRLAARPLLSLKAEE
jgi:hypothetical protein